MKKDLSETTFEELSGRTFELIHVVNMLCEVCQKPLGKKEKSRKSVSFSTREDYQNIMTRAKAHDHAEIDFDAHKIYFYDHDFPGDIHTECIDKL